MYEKNEASVVKIAEKYLNYLDEEDSMLFYNPIKQECVIGVHKLENSGKCINKKQIYYLNIQTFNGRKGTECWEGFDNNEIIFQHYIVITIKGIREIVYGNKKRNMSNSCVIGHINKYKIIEDDYSEWEKLFCTVKERIKEGVIEKAVVSRRIEIHFEKEIDVKNIILKLMRNNKDSFVFMYRTNNKTFLGASPEVLVEKNKNRITSYALAGTIAKDNASDLNAGRKLLKDEKNIIEHNIVVENIVNVMRSVTKEVTVGKTELMGLKNLYHLKTIISANDNSLSLKGWVKLLHPTPAMGGKPKEKAIELIEKYEKHDRGLFAAPIGLVDENGDGIFVVGIRSALIIEDKIYAFAGCGIVEQSDCREEYEEINNKLRTIIEAL